MMSERGRAGRGGEGGGTHTPGGAQIARLEGGEGGGAQAGRQTWERAAYPETPSQAKSVAPAASRMRWVKEKKGKN